MANTPNYNFIISTGSDIVNPLTQIFPNFTSLDSILKGVENKTIGTATELKTGTVHALTRADQDAPMFRFQATSNFETNDTFTVDGLQVSALDVAGQALANGAFIIGSMVLCELRDNLLTVYVSGSSDAETLEGHAASYFATASDLATVDGKADANKVLIDALTSDLSDMVRIAFVDASIEVTGAYNVTEFFDISTYYSGKIPSTHKNVIYLGALCIATPNNPSHTPWYECYVAGTTIGITNHYNATLTNTLYVRLFYIYIL